MHSETTPKIGPKYDLFIIFIIETLSRSLVRLRQKYNLRSVPPVNSSILNHENFAQGFFE